MKFTAPKIPKNIPVAEHRSDNFGIPKKYLINKKKQSFEETENRRRI